MNVNLNIQP